MPREPIPLIRQGGFIDAEKIFILSYEGTVSEKKYFEDFRKSDLFNNSGLIETISLKRPKDRGSDPINVKKLLQEAKREFNFKNTDEFWLIIDRDHWETTHNHNFDKLVEDCKAEKNFYLAMSNPCFEIWLILHLKDVNEYSNEEKNAIFENEKISNKKNHIDVVLGQLQRKDYNKRPDPEVFNPLTLTAIERAKSNDILEEDYPKSIGTHIYKLIEKLIDNENPNA
jgi:hypothetical protein